MTCATRRANRTIASTTPTPTPIARLPVATTTTIVTVMTSVSDSGIRRSVDGLTLCQSTVEIATTIMTAASATIGIRPMSASSPVTSASRNRPATTVESRVRAPPIFTFTTVCPIIAQPAMPP